MPILRIQNGVLGEADPNRSDGRGTFTPPTKVSENPNQILDTYAFIRSSRNLEGERLSRRAEARRQWENESKKQKVDFFRKAQQRAVATGSQFKTVNPAQLLAEKEVKRQALSGPDFNQFEAIAVQSDFGAAMGRHMGDRSDYEMLSTTGNPLTKDGTYGDVTDYDRYQKGRPFALKPVGPTPGGGNMKSEMGESIANYNNRGEPMGSMLNSLPPKRYALGDDGDWWDPTSDYWDDSASAGPAAPDAPAEPSFWDKLLQAGETALSSTQVQTALNQAAAGALTSAGQSAGVIAKPAPAPAPALLTKILPAPLTGVAKIGNFQVRKEYLVLAGLGIGAALLAYTLFGRKTNVIVAR